MESKTSNRSFHFLSQLPVELRYAIWRECLPHRVVEIDYAVDDWAYLCLKAPPCNLQLTTDINRRPPVISRVCRESRYVAFETGNHRAWGSPPPEAAWKSNLLTTKPWMDLSRDAVHLNWTPCYEADGSFIWGEGSALDYLAWNAKRARGGSFMFDYLDNFTDGGVDIEERIGALQQLRNGLVVMDIIVVHARFETAAKTGLFGLLGDACIQLVDVSDRASLNTYFDLAEKCEAKGFISRPQDFRRQSPEAYKKTLRDKLAETFCTQDAEHLPLLSPAVMFRFCPRWCNHVLPLPRRSFMGR